MPSKGIRFYLPTGISVACFMYFCTVLIHTYSQSCDFVFHIHPTVQMLIMQFVGTFRCMPGHLIDLPSIITSGKLFFALVSLSICIVRSIYIITFCHLSLHSVTLLYSLMTTNYDDYTMSVCNQCFNFYDAITSNCQYSYCNYYYYHYNGNVS